MKKIIILSVLSLGFLLSCKEKTNEVKSGTDSLTQNVVDKVEKGDSFQAKVISSNFNKVQNSIDLKSDTVYVTNYWATWCPPCVQEIPDFVELQNEYKDKKVKFIFVSIDAAEDKEIEVQSFVEKYKMKNVYQIPSDELSKVIGIDSKLSGRAIPVTIVQKGDRKESIEGSAEKVDVSQKVEAFLN